MLGKVGTYSTAVVCSVALHVGLVALLVSKWVPDEPRQQVVTPKFIDAKLLELKAKP